MKGRKKDRSPLMLLRSVVALALPARGRPPPRRAARAAARPPRGASCRAARRSARRVEEVLVDHNIDTAHAVIKDTTSAAAHSDLAGKTACNTGCALWEESAPPGREPRHSQVRWPTHPYLELNRGELGRARPQQVGGHRGERQQQASQSQAVGHGHGFQRCSRRGFLLAAGGLPPAQACGLGLQKEGWVGPRLGTLLRSLWCGKGGLETWAGAP